MKCAWILRCRRTPTVFYLGRFFCSHHARIIQGFRAKLGTAPPSGGSSQRATGAVLSDPFDGAAPPLSESELLDIVENDGWRDVEIDLFLEHGMTLDDLRYALEKRL